MTSPEPLHRTKRAVYVVLLVVAIAASGFAIYNQFSSDNTVSSLADQVAQACDKNIVLAKSQGLNCSQAKDAQNSTAPIIGTKGDKGDKGDTGDQGPTGIGLPGTDGAQGATGQPGASGPTGANGTDGKSVTGAQGVPGPQGEPGVAGPKGDTGATGPQGQQGEKGDKGDTASLPAQIPFGPFPDGTYVICYLNASGTAYGNCQPAPTAGLRK